MFRFTLQGRIGRIEQVKGTSAILRISLAADRLVEGPRDGSRSAWTKTEWLSVVSFDESLNARLLAEREAGQIGVGITAILEGRIEPRKRQVGDAKVADYTFVLTRLEPLTKPAARSTTSKAAAKAA